MAPVPPAGPGAARGVKPRSNWTGYDRGPFAGIDLNYDRETYHGYSKIYGFLDQERKDDFGQENKNVPAPEDRGALAGTPQAVPVQRLGTPVRVELHLRPQTTWRSFFPDEYFAGKDRRPSCTPSSSGTTGPSPGCFSVPPETASRTRPESAPEVGFHLIGQSLAEDKLTAFSDSKAGVNRYRLPKLRRGRRRQRLDGPAGHRENEINWPVHLGPVNVVPTPWGGRTTGRTSRRPATSASTTPPAPRTSSTRTGPIPACSGRLACGPTWTSGGSTRTSQSRVWDLNGIKHVITPGDRQLPGRQQRRPDDLFPMDPDIEQHVQGVSGVARRRHPGDCRPAGHRRERLHRRLDAPDRPWRVLRRGGELPPSDGRFFFDRPRQHPPQLRQLRLTPWTFRLGPSSATETTTHRTFGPLGLAWMCSGPALRTSWACGGSRTLGTPTSVTGWATVQDRQCTR